MGAWGVGIFQNDVASDIKDDYGEALYMLKDDEKVENLIIDTYKEEGYEFWLIFAVLQWKYGRLSEKVRKKGLEAIENDLKEISEIWEEKEIPKRIKILEETKDLLNSKMPEKKKIRKPSWSFISPFKIGQIVQMKQHICINRDYDEERFWKYHEQDFYFLTQVVGIEQRPPHKAPFDRTIFVLLDWATQEPATEEDLLEFRKNARIVCCTEDDEGQYYLFGECVEKKN